MGFWPWIYINGLSLLQATSIVLGLAATCHTIRANTNERKIQNLLSLTAAHRELWLHFEADSDLHRIRLSHVNLEEEPVTPKETRFIHLLILHLRASYKAKKIGMDFDDEAVRTDIKQFFKRPIASQVWERSRQFQDQDFVRFVETARESDTTAINF